MVAFVKPDHQSCTTSSAGRAAALRSPGARHLRLVVDNSASRRGHDGVGVHRVEQALRAGVGLVALALAVILGAMVAVRLSQDEAQAITVAGASVEARPASPVGGDPSAPTASESFVDLERSSAGGVEGRSLSAQSVVVRPGDSLWSIAARYAPDRDRRSVVDALADANDGSSLRVGQRLVIPPELVD